MLPLGFVKCLLVLGGGTEVNKMGRLWISRMGHDEITRQPLDLLPRRGRACFCEDQRAAVVRRGRRGGGQDAVVGDDARAAV